MSKQTVVAYKNDDVERLRDHQPGAAFSVLPLTPLAAHAAAECGFAQLDPLKLHNNAAHERDVLKRQQLEEFLEHCLCKSQRLTLAAKQVLVDYAVDVCGVAWRLWGLLASSEHWLFLHEGEWRSTTDRRLVHRVVLKRILGAWNESSVVVDYGATPCRLRFQLQQQNVRFLKAIAPTRPIVFNSLGRGFATVAQEINKMDPCVYQVEFSPLNGTAQLLEYIRTWRGWAEADAAPAPRTATVPVPPRAMPAAARLASQILDEVPDAVAKAGVDVLRPAILRYVEWAESIIPAYRRYLQLMQARAVLTYDVADPLNAALAQAANDVGVPTLLLCHTSVSGGYDPISAEAKRRRTIALASSSRADLVYVQSPLAKAAANTYAPHIRCRKIAPIVWGRGIAENFPNFQAGKKTKKERIVLHVGYYFRWPQYMPWVYETAHEHVAALAALVRATAKIPDARLIIRPKDLGLRGEFDEETLRKMLPKSSCCEIRSEGTFYDELQNADVVVSFHSATIEESLMARRPVLLFGGGQRYLHVPAMREKPGPRNRAAVYAPYGEDDLHEMLSAIIEEHAAAPLTDDELAEHVWPRETTPGLTALAQEVLALPAAATRAA